MKAVIPMCRLAQNRNKREETRDKRRFACFLSRVSCHGSDAQVILEFTFCMIIIFLLIYGTVMVFRWTGVDLVERRKAHDSLLVADIAQNWGGCMVYDHTSPCVEGGWLFGCPCLMHSQFSDGPYKQIAPYISKPQKLNAVWMGNFIF